MRPLPLCTGEQPLVLPCCGFISSRTNLTTRNAIELATRASFLTITHCMVSKAFLFCRHLSWGKEETQIGKVKEERKTPLFKVLFYLGITAQALLLITPDRCYINPKKHNSSVSSERFSNSSVLCMDRDVTSLPPYRNRRPRR